MDESESDYNFKIWEEKFSKEFSPNFKVIKNYATLNGFVNDWNCAKVLW